MMFHRGPYSWNSDGTMIVCEKMIDGFGWVPFAASLTDDDPDDRAMAEDIETKRLANFIRVNDYVAPDPAPIEEIRLHWQITAVQLRLGARQFGVRDALEAYAASDPDLSDLYEYGTEFHRLSPFIAGFAGGLSWDEPQTDDFFRFCETR